MNLTESAAIDLSLGDIKALDQVIDREALTDLANSLFDLFSISLRIYSARGALLAQAQEEAAIHAFLRQSERASQALLEDIEGVSALIPEDEVAVYDEVTGARYQVIPLAYQGRPVGRCVLGPYLPAELSEVPKKLLKLDSALGREEILAALMEMPRVREGTIVEISNHVRCVLELLLFSNHRAFLTSEMHLASVRENYRELAQKTEKLQDAYDRLKELDKLKSNFLATISHELRTPLTSIIGYSEMLEAGLGGDLSPDQREFVETIHTKGDELLALISSLLDLSKLEQGVLRIHTEPTAPAALIERLADTFVPAAHKKSIDVQQKIEADLPKLRVDPVRFHQILSNLAENAIKFTPENGVVRFEAELGEMTQGEDDGGFGAVLLNIATPAVVFRISDTGPGIPSEALPRIFDAFYQVDGTSTREHGGTGLGLSIVKKLVDAHQGKVSVESTVGKGTQFRIAIPLSAESA